MPISLKLSEEGKEKCDSVCYINWPKYFKINKVCTTTAYLAEEHEQCLGQMCLK